MRERTVPVERVAKKGMPDMAHVDSDLVSASGLYGQAYERETLIIFYHFIGCEGGIAADLRDPLNIAVKLPRDRDIHAAFAF